MYEGGDENSNDLRIDKRSSQIKAYYQQTEKSAKGKHRA